MYARHRAIIATPIGMITIAASDRFITGITIDHLGTPQHGSSSLADHAAEQLRQWLAGERLDFDLPLASLPSPRGEQLRQALMEIPYGETISYGALARKIGSGARAIGQACARNPLPIIVPCHRVLAAGEKLGHYSGGDGPATKAWLIDHERKYRLRRKSALI